MRNYLLGALVIFIISGMKQGENMQEIKYRTYEEKNGRDKKVLYCLNVPQGGKLSTVRGSHERELEVSYPDSSFIYITNDANGGSHLNYQNVSSLGNDVYTNKLLKDTLLLQGVQNDGRFWKEIKQGQIVIGYLNVSSKKKVQYDKALSSLRKK